MADDQLLNAMPGEGTMTGRNASLPRGWTLREWQRADAAAVRQLVAESLPQFGFQPDPGGSEADLEDIEAAYFSRGGAFYVIANAEGEIIGTAGFLRVDGATCKLRKMYVRRDHRGRGLGRVLLAHVLGRAAALGYEHVILETSRRMTAAVSLYERAGFRRVDLLPASARCDTTYRLDLHPDGASVR
jgi:putative acetyltransferase